ncbi:MAG: M20 peptidase family dipeptidase, partial [Burkholderiales bacterium]|nr:M20 peptidase family dipeptidase [Burkholderiales bacterium]
IPPSARATLHLRHVVGTDLSELAAKVRAHLARHGFDDIVVDRVTASAATRLDPDNPWVRFSLDSIARSTGVAPVLLPNLGGSLPNEVFADILGLPTIWVPHSYGACNQHAPDEHLLAPLARQALELMTGLFWDLGEQAAMLPRRMASPPDSRMASPPDSLRASPLESRAVSSLDPRAAAA